VLVTQDPTTDVINQSAYLKSTVDMEQPPSKQTNGTPHGTPFGTPAPDFSLAAQFFQQARDHFREAPRVPTEPVRDWLLTQKERLLSRLAAHWQFLRRCELYHVVPSHLTERGMRMTFTCAVTPEVSHERHQIGNEMRKFIEACGFKCDADVTESFITCEITLGG